MRVKKQQLEPCTEQLIGSGLRKEYNRAICCHPVSLTYMLNTAWEMSVWRSHKLESRQPGDINNLRYVDNTSLIAESKEVLSNLLMSMKEESEKTGLKLINKNF